MPLKILGESGQYLRIFRLSQACNRAASMSSMSAHDLWLRDRGVAASGT
jgi:hypothetical protein